MATVKALMGGRRKARQAARAEADARFTEGLDLRTARLKKKELAGIPFEGDVGSQEYKDYRAERAAVDRFINQKEDLAGGYGKHGDAWHEFQEGFTYGADGRKVPLIRQRRITRSSNSNPNRFTASAMPAHLKNPRTSYSYKAEYDKGWDDHNKKLQAMRNRVGFSARQRRAQEKQTKAGRFGAVKDRAGTLLGSIFEE